MSQPPHKVASNESVELLGINRMKCDHLEALTVRELGDVAEERGSRPSVILAEYELRRDPSRRRA